MFFFSFQCLRPWGQVFQEFLAQASCCPCSCPKPAPGSDTCLCSCGQVFEEFLAQCGRGLTPNPDLACNRHIKFDALLEFADRLGAELVATGAKKS